MTSTVVTDPAAAAAARTQADLVPLVDAFRALQDPTGAVTGDEREADRLLGRILETYRELAPVAAVPPEQVEAVVADVGRWRAQGLARPPAFEALLDAYGPPADGEGTLVCAPLVATNGPAPRGKFLECLFAVRDEVSEVRALERVYPHPKNGCQSMRLLAGSAGLITGNCIVFFPENIAHAREHVETTFAQFFFNKFHKIYQELTLPHVRRVTGTGAWSSGALDSEQTFHARSVWGYLHDYHHYRGPRPWDEAMEFKLRFFPGLLEEIKVDAQTALECGRASVPYGREVVEMMLLERMFRYPGQPDAPTNFDAGTGLLIFEWLASDGRGVQLDGDRVRLDIDGCLEGLEALVAEILDAEAAPDQDYPARAEALVRRFIAPGEQGRRLSVPERYGRTVRAAGAAPGLLDFHDLVPGEAA